MGYLSQKKKYARESVFLQLMLGVFGLLAVAAFLPGQAPVVKIWLFQIYLLNLLVFLYALYLRRLFFSLMFSLLLVINYFQIAASAHIFFNNKIEAGHHISVVYAPDNSLEVEAQNAIILRRGHLVLGQKNVAPFLAIEKNGHVFTLIRVDLELVSAPERKMALRQLRNFISEQDDPVILFGDFGEPVWSDEMKQFLQDTSLEVKNRLLFTGRGRRYNYFRAPGFYVLSFHNTGIETLEVEAPENAEAYPLIRLVLGFY